MTHPVGQVHLLWQSPELCFSIDGPSRTEHFELLGRKYDASHPTLHPVVPDLTYAWMSDILAFNSSHWEHELP